MFLPLRKTVKKGKVERFSYTKETKEKSPMHHGIFPNRCFK